MCPETAVIDAVLKGGDHMGLADRGLDVHGVTRFAGCNASFARGLDAGGFQHKEISDHEPLEREFPIDDALYVCRGGT